MFAQVETKNGLLNVAQLQEKVDEIIFDYIDTSKNWGKACKGLSNLFLQTVQFYEKYVNENDIPNSNVYWTLFIDVVGRLIYFKTLAGSHLTDIITDEDLENIIEGYIVAANCLPNVNANHENELLDEISESFEKLRLLDGEKGKFKQSIIEKNNTVKDNLTFFYNYSIKLVKVNQ